MPTFSTTGILSIGIPVGALLLCIICMLRRHLCSRRECDSEKTLGDVEAGPDAHLAGDLHDDLPHTAHHSHRLTLEEVKDFIRRVPGIYRHATAAGPPRSDEVAWMETIGLVHASQVMHERERLREQAYQQGPLAALPAVSCGRANAFAFAYVA